MSLRSRVLGTLAVLVALVVPLVPSAGWAADPVRPEPGRPFFGPHLPYPDDTPEAYVERIGGLEPSTYTLPIPYPLDEGAISQLQQYAELVAERGAILLVDVQPAIKLQQLDDEEVAAEFASELAKLHDSFDTHVLVRYAPEMNGSWETWGQQPGAYVKSFRILAEAMSDAEGDDGDWSEMVWAPVYGSGYPYRRPDREGGANGALEQVIASERKRTDTNNDGELDTDDDAYAPYYPGDEWVDWVGLSMYRLGQSQGVRRNHVPPATEFRQRLEETWGYGEGGGKGSFYERFAEGHDKPMLVETAAFFNPDDPGPDALKVKSAWWRQVFAVLPDYPRISGISWLELARTEPEAIQEEPVDWRVSWDPEVAEAFSADLADAPLTLGPVLEPYVAPPGSSDEPGDSDAGSGPVNAPATTPLPESGSDHAPAWLLGAAVLMLLSLLIGFVLPRWRPRDPAPRDERVDLLRGGLLLGLVATLALVTGLDVVHAVDPLLVPVGAGLLLLVSGAAHGLRYRQLASTTSPWAATVTRWRRARTVYAIALLTALVTLGLDEIPDVATDLGTYSHVDAMFGYPPPAYAFWDLLSLDAAPWIVATLGLVAALVVVSPAFLFALHRGWWWAPLVVSWVLYGVGVTTDVSVLPLVSEDTLPVLVWQLPFVHGLVLGHQRAYVEKRRGRFALVAAVPLVAYAVLVLVDGISDEVPAMAVVACVAVAVLAFVTAAWTPLRLLLGWLLLPVGRRPLLVVPATVVLVVLLDVLFR